MRALSLTVGVALLFTALASAEDGTWRPSGLSAAPLSAHAKRSPYEGDTEAPRAGRKLFLRHCAACHGADARGTTSGPGLALAVQGVAPGAVFWYLTNGNRGAGMPSWAGLPEPRRWQIVAFLRTLGSAGTRDDPPDPSRTNR